MIHLSVQWPYLEWKRQSVSSRALGWTALVTCILCASTYNTFAKMLTGSLSPLTLFFVSELLTGFFVAMSFGLMPVLRDIGRIKKKKILPLLLIGMTNGTIGPILLFAGLQNSTAVNASLFTNMEMFFLVLLAVLVLKEPFRRKHVYSTVAITAGMLIISLRGFTEGLTLNWGDMLLILSSLSFALGSIIFRRSLHDVHPRLVLFVRAAVAVCCFFLLSPFIDHPLIEEIRAFPLAALPVLLGFGFISRFLNVFSFYEALDRLKVTTVSIVSNATVVTSLIFAWSMLHEPILPYHIIGGALIVLGTVVLEFMGVHPTRRHLVKHLQQRNGHR